MGRFFGLTTFFTSFSFFCLNKYYSNQVLNSHYCENVDNNHKSVEHNNYITNVRAISI